MADRALPTGTVTFLFSDMEGSTRLVQDLGPLVFTRILESHNDILRAAFLRHGGVERGTQGDSFLVMFREAPAAVAGAAEAQAALAQAAWPAEATVRVRMGLHTGVGGLGGDDYVGIDVNRAARITSLAHGGQVLLSDATRGLVEDALPPGVALRPVGEHRLKDLTRPVRLHQLILPNLRTEFPPLRAAERAQGNLPARLTSFIGREEDLTALRGLLDDKPLVTLTGPGGTGKTRLAIQLAHSVSDRFEHGVWLVTLEAIREPELVPATIATTLGMMESPGLSPTAQLTTFFADRSILLVLDNFEQVLAAAPHVGQLLQASDGLRVVVTSRAALRLSIEQEYPVAPLAVPDETELIDLAAPAESVRLFIERARRVRPGYAPSPADAQAVAEICRRLDGLPLGIELAAARVGLLPPRTIAERLTRQLDVPGGGTRDLPARQQTLERAISWSHELLDEPCRRLLARLSVFAGGFRLEEAETVAGPAEGLGVDVIEGLTTLAAQSLVQPMAGPDLPRFRLLETIRMFAAARLSEATEAEHIHRCHAAAYLALAEESARHMPGRDQVPWLDRLSVEHDNLRAAMAWAIEAGEAEIAHRLLAAAWRFWLFRGHAVQGREHAARVLAMPGAGPATTWRMRAVEAAAGLEWWGGNVDRADAHYRVQLELARQLGDDLGTADALFNLAHTRFTLSRQPIAIASLQEEAQSLYQKLGDERSLARLAWTAGYPLLSEGKRDEAEAVIRECLRRFIELGDEFYIALASEVLGGIATARRDVDEAVRQVALTLRSMHAMGDVASIALFLEQVAALWFAAGLPNDAATIYAAHAFLCGRHGVRPPLDVETYMGLGADIDGVRALLTSEEFREAAQRGRMMTADEVIEFITGEAESHIRSRTPATRPAG